MPETVTKAETKTAHTPDPWHHVHVSIPDRKISISPDDPPSAEVVRWGDPKDRADVCICIGPDQVANACLVATAPKLLRALENMLENFDAYPYRCSPDEEFNLCEIAREAQAAINEATVQD